MNPSISGGRVEGVWASLRPGTCALCTALIYKDEPAWRVDSVYPVCSTCAGDPASAGKSAPAFMDFVRSGGSKPPRPSVPSEKVASAPERPRFNWRCALSLHPWEKWVNFPQKTSESGNQLMSGQRRICPGCGLEQRRLIEVEL